MDITKGSFDYISRPVSKERSRAGSRESTVSLAEVGRVNQHRIGSLEAHLGQGGQTENMLLDQDSSDEENEDLDLQKAIEEMKRLDTILAVRISQEKEMTKQRRELHQKLWQELKNLEPRSSKECSDEAKNTQMFLELTASTSEGSSDDDDFLPVFGTQISNENSALDFRVGNKEVREHTESSDFLEEAQEMRRGKQTDSSQTMMQNTKYRQDFVKKNIELVGRAGGLMMMIHEEKERLEELIKDLENESYDDPSAKPKNLRPRSSSECSSDAENNWLYLELTTRTSKSSSEEEGFVPVFGTQVPDESSGLNFRVWNEGVREHTESSGFLEEDQEMRRGKQTDSRQVQKTKHRQDFVKKNIELAGGAGGLMMTHKEKERLEEILNDESYDDPSAKPKPGEGYQPDEAQLNQLFQIDARLQLLLPVEDFLFVQSPYAAHSSSQGGHFGSDGERGGELMAGGKTPQELTEARDKGECLQDIQQQLQHLGHSQQAMSLPEEQLRSLLMECEMAQSRHSGSGAGESSLPYCALDARAISLLIRMPRLTSRALSDLLLEASATHNTSYQCEEATLD
ncbi:fibrous sheath-interacting protein 1 isoform X2 [Electrophorus electricus]|uniref:fibrous sheath-interacting protein 1 isoform X2 n=1 Tax=Electrophorus electricus TaxID=8005 RepID=UPI0015D0334F|nr:fibrous sheath-interacting protein 1 isoform X2 [Electrophorus electricus]